MPKQRRWVWWLVWGLCWLLGPIFCRIDIRGRENLPKSGGAVVACNHNFGPDFILLSMASTRELCFMAKAEAFSWNPILSSILKAGGVFPVRRGKGDNSAIETAVELAEEGDIVAMFPEGTRSRSGELMHGKSGAARIAMAAGVPIIPASVTNSASVLKRKSWKRPVVTVSFARPIVVQGSHLDDEDETDAARALTHEVMVEIARLLPPDLRGEYGDDVVTEVRNSL